MTSPSETQTETQVRFLLERQCAEVGRKIASSLPAGVGFLFLAFDFGEGGNSAYISNADRQSMIKLLRELATKLEGDG